MNKIATLIAIFCFCITGNSLAQYSKHPSKSKEESKSSAEYNFKKLTLKKEIITSNKVPSNLNFSKNKRLSAPQKPLGIVKKILDQESKTPIFIQANVLEKTKAKSDMRVQAYQFLDELKKEMSIRSPKDEFEIISVDHDETRAKTHLKLAQKLNALPIFGTEIILHSSNGIFHKMNGRYFKSPEVDEVRASISDLQALEAARLDVEQYTNLQDLSSIQQNIIQETESELLYYPSKDGNQFDLAWHISFHPNVKERWSYFVSAIDGHIIKAYKNSCSLHNHVGHCSHSTSKTIKKNTSERTTLMDGSATANATDLLGVNRTIDTYEVGNTFYLIDGSRTMFKLNQSNLPNEPVGAIWTIDAGNTSPENSNFSQSHVSSNNNNWSNRTAVSAHYNAGQAYEYFKNVHQRESLNAQGGNIISIINVSEKNGSSLENAFWNGAAMFYGNGGQAFEPLAKALDVAGHEISHGVVQTTANLVYEGQSGAMNESFADIFGAMIDRDDWKMGEDVVNPSVFPSGALRDLQNPNNGGSSLNDSGWQPKNMSEYQNLPNTPQGDNGGVHVNSGIPNHAFYQLATAIGKDKAEDIYYEGLTRYLVKSSQFVDLRIAIEQSAVNLFGNGSAELNAVRSAFDFVQIGGGTGGDFEEELETNPGEDLILVSDTDYSELFIITPDASQINSLSMTDHISKPSISDDGSEIVFIDSSRRMRYISINWNTGETNEIVLESNPIWRNVAISKDGNRIAAITNDEINEINVYDFGREEWEEFTLFNPTFTAGISTGDVRYADVMEFDHSGEFVMYDAFNELNTSFGNAIDYWDVGFIQVWSNSNNNWTDGQNIQKLFSGIPENTSIGNPTFAKDAPFIVAFDFLDDNGDISVLANNIETGKTSDPPIFVNDVLNYPNFSIDDSKIIFDAADNYGNEVLGVANLQSDHINVEANSAVVLVEGGRWGVWFALGSRDLVSTEENFIKKMSLRPNPSSNAIQVEFNSEKKADLQIEIKNLLGQQVVSEQIDVINGYNSKAIDITDLNPGNYILTLSSDSEISSLQFVKQ